MNRIIRTSIATGVALAAATLMSACGGPASNASNLQGTYTTDITNRASTCPGNWTVGEHSSGITVDITQQGSAVTAQVTGGTGLYLEVATGSNTFNGTADGNSLTANLLGTTSQSLGNCSYTWKAVLSAKLNGNALQGTVTYTPQTNGNADCTAMSVQGCTRSQEVAGVRPAPTN